MRIYAAMAQKEWELINERTRAALAAAKARGKALGGDRGYRPTGGPDAAAAGLARRGAAERSAHRLALEVETLQATGIYSPQALARALNEKGVLPPGGRGAWTHTTVARLLQRVAVYSSRLPAIRWLSRFRPAHPLGLITRRPSRAAPGINLSFSGVITVPAPKGCWDQAPWR